MSNIHSLKSSFNLMNIITLLYAFFLSYLISYECLVLFTCTNLVSNKKWLNLILYTVLI